MPARTPESRVLVARIAAHERWAREADRSAATAKARRALLDRFEREVDPDGTLDPAERAVRAEHARRAFYSRLSLRAAQARSKSRAARQIADDLDRIAVAADADLAGEGDAA